MEGNSFASFSHVTDPLACSDLGGHVVKLNLSSVGRFFSLADLM